ncbi:MAG: T9SS type A sorting domain-containing protein [Bacteroidales bacterium]
MPLSGGSIPVIFALNQEQQSLHVNYLAYFAIQKKMEKEGKTILSLDSAGLVEIHNLYTTSNEPVRSYARNILIGNGKLYYSEPYIFTDALKSGRVIKEHRKGALQQVTYMKLFPNPAKDYIIAEYTLKDGVLNASLEIVDVSGKTLKTIVIKGKHEYLVIPMNDCMPGIFLCKLFANNKVVTSIKFSIIK